MIFNVQAMWGLHFIRTSSKSIQPIQGGLSLTSELNVEQQETTEAQNPLDNKGGDKPCSFSVTLLNCVAAGALDPMSEYNSWVRDLGKSFPFLINYIPWGASRMILKNVSMNNELWDAQGRLSSAEMTIEFEEDMPATAKAKDVEKAKEKGDKSTLKKGPSKSDKVALSKLRLSDADLAAGRKAMGVSS